MTGQVTVTQEIDASAEQVWAMVADVTRMGEWSPENRGAKWLPGVRGPQPGARFLGRNRKGYRRWWTVGTVVDADRGRVFAFRVTAPVLAVAEWRFTFEATATGCQVTESWADRRGRIVRALGDPVTGVADRAAHNQAGMEQTLARLKAAAEAAATSSRAD